MPRTCFQWTNATVPIAISMLEAAFQYSPVSKIARKWFNIFIQYDRSELILNLYSVFSHDYSQCISDCGFVFQMLF